MNEWRIIKENRQIKWDHKAKELRQRVESCEIFHRIIAMVLSENGSPSLAYYAKKQVLLQRILQGNMMALKSHIHSVLQQDIMGYNRQEIDKLDLSAIPKQAYQQLVHPSPKDWLHFPTELTTLSNMFSPSSVQLASVYHFIRINFTLKKPYISLDDDPFYIIDNPVVKDPVLKMPIVRPATLKGAFRYVAMKTRVIEPDLKDLKYFVDERIKLVKLFGSEKEAAKTFLDKEFSHKFGQTEGKKAVEAFKERIKQCVSESGNREGRLIFYPVFFDSVGLDVIAPHNRKNRTIAEMGPILFETVPADSHGTFSLLYFPFDLLPALRSRDSAARAKAIEEMKEDLEVLKEAVPAMLLTYGFAAKKTSGYSVVEDRIDFCIDSIDMMKSNFEAYKNQMNLLIRTLVSG